jgi:AsmA protein
MNTDMKIRFPKIVLRLLKYSGIGLGLLLALMFLLPFMFPTYVSNSIKKWANHAIVTELNFSKARLSFFNHFPSLTLTLYDVTLQGSNPYHKDTLVMGKELALGVNLFSLLSKTVRINEIYLTRGKLDIKIDEKGLPNYNVYKTSASAANNNQPDTVGANLRLEHIQLEECELAYKDQSIPFQMAARRLNYIGKGDLSKAIFDLSSEIIVEGFDLVYYGQAYLENKNLDAQLITQINTNSLALIFQKNDLKINQLPVAFKGKFNFLKDGYRMDFSVTSAATEFKNLFTALPPEAVTWVDKTTVKGQLEMDAELKGDYIASKKTAPNLSFNMRITNGSVAAKQITESVENIYFNFHFLLPQLNMDSMTVKIDSLHASMGKDEIMASIQTKGLPNPL